MKKKPKQRADELLEIVNAYKITKELGDLILDFQNGDTERVTALLDEGKKFLSFYHQKCTTLPDYF